MHDTGLIDSLVLNRRFIRLQAVLNFYAFYIGKQANYDRALDQIHADLMPDVFVSAPVDTAQIAQESQQALAVFDAHLVSSSIPTEALGSISSHTRTVVTRAVANYKSELDQDTRKLEGGLLEALSKINQACIRIWQLLAEWTCIAKQQTERSKLHQQRGMAVSMAISHSQVLQGLQQNRVLDKLIQQEVSGWRDHLPLVESWYHRFIKQCPSVQQYLTLSMPPYQDEQLLILLIEDVIFKELDIQTFFGHIDPKWSIHKRIVKKQIRRDLMHLLQEGAGVSVSALDWAIDGKKEQYFYTNLVQKTLQKDADLESLIAEKAQNWSVDRVMLLDKTIIKLALCEMLYFQDIPIKVSINEYIDLSKTYSTPKSSQFINGLLDAVATTLSQRARADKKN